METGWLFLNRLGWLQRCSDSANLRVSVLLEETELTNYFLFDAAGAKC